MFSSLTNFYTSNWHICWIIGDFVILTPPRSIFWLSGAIFPSLRLYKNILDTMKWLKCILKCLYQFVFKCGQFLDFKFTCLLNYWRFCDFDPSKGHFLAFFGKISAQSVKYKKTRNSGHLKNVTFLFYFFERDILGPNWAP